MECAPHNIMARMHLLCSLQPYECACNLQPYASQESLRRYRKLQRKSKAASSASLLGPSTSTEEAGASSYGMFGLFNKGALVEGAKPNLTLALALAPTPTPTPTPTLTLTPTQP